MKHKIINILLTLAIIASVWAITFDPFGSCTGHQYACNAVVLLVILPLLACGVVRNNPDIFNEFSE